jgi:hypothetical protein
VKRRDALLVALSFYEPHRLERRASAIVSQAVDRDDAGMLERAGYLGLRDELRPAVLIIGVPLLDLLDRYRAVKLVARAPNTSPRPTRT